MCCQLRTVLVVYHLMRIFISMNYGLREENVTRRHVIKEQPAEDEALQNVVT
jgi:hypothetical protein